MGYEQQVLEKIRDMEQRADDRTALFQAISDAFDTEGANRVQEILATRGRALRQTFDATLAKLEAML